MWCKNASHFKLSFQWQVLGFQQLLWNPFNWSSMKIWGVQLKFSSQTHPDFIKDLIFLYLPIKYICKCVWVCINQYLLDNCCFVLFWVFFSSLKEQFPFSLWRMNSALCMQWELEWMTCGRCTAPAPGWDLEHTTPLLLPSPVWYSALVVPSSPSSPTAWVRTGEAQDVSLGAWCNGNTMVTKNWGLSLPWSGLGYCHVISMSLFSVF